MSSFIVSDNTIWDIVDYVEDACLTGSVGAGVTLARGGFHMALEDEDLELAKALMEYNRKAVNYRYVENIKTDEVTRKPGSKNKYQVLMSLRCWMYQCSEGDLRESRFFKMMEEIEVVIMREILDDDRRYDEALWNR